MPKSIVALATVAYHTSVCQFVLGSSLRNEPLYCIGPGQSLFVIHGQLEFNCIVSYPLCGCLRVDGHLCALHVSRLPVNRFHPLVFICSRLLSSSLHRWFSCLFVSYLRPCRHRLCRLVGLIGQMTNVFVTLGRRILTFWDM